MCTTGRLHCQYMEERTDHLQLGSWGEQLASDYLCRKGYTILEHDWHSGHRDIDIIARQDNIVVFVEVKTRRNQDYIDPESAVDYKKLKNLRLAINHYIKYRRIDTTWRFDVLTVVGMPGAGTPQINHIEDFPLY